MNTDLLVDSYATLNRPALGLLAPIATEEAYEVVLETIEAVMERMEQDVDHPLRPLFELLSERVEQYESQQDLPEVPAAERLRYLMGTHGLNQSQLAQATGIAQSNLSAVLRGTREFSKGMAQKLADYFSLPVGVFLG